MKVAPQKTRTFLALCAAPLLLALAASAQKDYPSPSPDSVEESGGVAPPTPYPNPTIGYKDTPAEEEAVSEGAGSSGGAEEYEEEEGSSMGEGEPVEGSSMGEGEKEEGSSMGEGEPVEGSSMGEGEEEEGSSMGEEEEGSSMTGGEEAEEKIPSETPGNGGICTTYDEDAEVAKLLEGTCEWNTYMCCWTGHDGQGNFYGNADVCRVVDYPNEGDVLEMPRDDEGPVYCHGFAWEAGSDVNTHILPLYHFVRNVNRTDDGGYYGNVVGAPECGCIEEMPMVDHAACSKFGWDGIQPCWDNSLRSQYKYNLDEPHGEMETNLVRECDNDDVPEYDFRTCEHNTYMCCWTENDGQGMADNTDVCRVGATEYPGESEGEVHCHGFVWPDGATDKYIHLLAQFVQHYDHRDRRGYFGNLPDAPMCGCIEDMPEVSEADCTTYDQEPGREGKFTACTNNDLRTSFEEHHPGSVLPNLVDECDNKEG